MDLSERDPRDGFTAEEMNEMRALVREHGREALEAELAKIEPPPTREAVEASERSVAVHPWRWLRGRFGAGWYAYRVPTGWGVHFGFGYIDVTRWPPS